MNGEQAPSAGAGSSGTDSPEEISLEELARRLAELKDQIDEHLGPEPK